MQTTVPEDLKQSEEWAKYLTHSGWQIEKVAQGTNIFFKKAPLIGSVAKIQRSSVIPSIKEIDHVAKKHRALFVKLEPSVEAQLIASLPTNFELDHWPLVPTRTIHIDLNPNEDKIFAKFSKDARYSIRKAQRLDVKVKHEDKNLQTFFKLLKETGNRKKFWVLPEADFGAKAKAFKSKYALLLAYHNSQAVAGAFILFHDKVAYYHHAASNPKGRETLAPYPILWEAIKLAKKKGCHTLDLEGIYDPRYKIYKRFRKIGTFKKKFGGEEVEYPGSFVRYYNPIVRLAFKLAHPTLFS